MSVSEKKLPVFRIFYDDRISMWRFYFKAKNGKVMVKSNGYRTKQGARVAIEVIKQGALCANIVI